MNIEELKSCHFCGASLDDVYCGSCGKLNEGIEISRQDFSEKSSDIAEKIHHASCKFECCGSHEDFVNFTKCPKCGMTEEIQDEHNDLVWEIIDEAEYQLSTKYKVIDEDTK